MTEDKDKKSDHEESKHNGDEIKNDNKEEEHRHCDHKECCHKDDERKEEEHKDGKKKDDGHKNKERKESVHKEDEHSDSELKDDKKGEEKQHKKHMSWPWDDKHWPWNLDTAKSLTISLYVLNALLIFTSIVVISCASHDLYTIKSFKEVIRGRNMISDIVIVIGMAAGIALAIYGSVGATRKKRQALHVEAGGLLVLMVVLVALSAVVIVSRPTEDQILRDRLAESFARASSSPADREGWNKVETSLQCCGVQGPSDYARSLTPPHVPPSVALSCCTNAKNDATDIDNQRARTMCIQQRLFYQQGCQPLVSETASVASLSVVVSVLVLAIIQILTFLLIGAILVQSQMHQHKRRHGRQIMLDVLVMIGILLGTMFAVSSSLLLAERTGMGALAEVGGVTILVTSMLFVSALGVLFIVGPYRNKTERL